MVGHLWAVFLLFYILRGFLGPSNSARRVYRRAQVFLPEYAGQEGGNAFLVGRRKIVYRPQGSKLEAEIDCTRSARLTFRLPASTSFRASFYRIPRMFYAFAEAFISSGLRFEGLPYLVASSSAEAVTALKTKSAFLPLLAELSRYRFSMQFRDGEMIFRKKLRAGELTDRDFHAMIRLVLDFSRICAKEMIHIPVQPVESENRCAYCKEPMHEDASIIYCSVCGTPHHSDCFQLNGKCSVFGCESSRPVETPLSIAN